MKEVCYNSSTKKPTKFWTVSLLDRIDCEMDIWTHVFSTEQKADDFIMKVEDKLRRYDVDTVRVTKDCTTNIDDDFYLDWLDERYGEFDVEEWWALVNGSKK